MRHEDHLVDRQAIENQCEVARLAGLLVSILRMAREAHAAQVGDDHRVVGHEHFSERLPHVSGVAKSVEQQDGRAGSARAHVLLGVSNVDE